MNEETFEDIEWLLSVILLACSCMGMFLMSCWVAYLFMDSLPIGFILAAFLVSVALTWAINELRLEMRYRHLLIKAQREEEKAAGQKEKADELYAHLKV